MTDCTMTRQASKSPNNPSSPKLAPRAARRPQLADPTTTLTRWWHAWSKAPPPPELQHLIDPVTAGHGLFFYQPPRFNGLR